MLAEDDMPHSACVRCATCDGFPCLVHAKSDAEVLGVRPGARALQRHPAHQRRGGAPGDQRRGHGRHRRRRRARRRARRRYTADIVVVSCGAANSAKLLLASASDAHPNGLANGSDQVGRNYMFHNSAAVLALSKEPNPTVFQKTLGLNDFYFGTDDVDYPLGNIQMVGKSSAEMYRGEKPLQTRLAPEWTLRDVARHAVDFWLSTEDLPRAGEPGDACATTGASRSPTRRPTTSPRSGCCTSSRRCSGTSGCTTTTCSRATPT